MINPADKIAITLEITRICVYPVRLKPWCECQVPLISANYWLLQFDDEVCVFHRAKITWLWYDYAQCLCILRFWFITGINIIHVLSSLYICEYTCGYCRFVVMGKSIWPPWRVQTFGDRSSRWKFIEFALAIWWVRLGSDGWNKMINEPTFPLY
jgi:hypothetical protein